MVPVSGRKDDAVIKKLVNSIGELIFSDSRVGHLMEVLGEGGREGGREGGGRRKEWKEMEDRE